MLATFISIFALFSLTGLLVGLSFITLKMLQVEQSAVKVPVRVENNPQPIKK